MLLIGYKLQAVTAHYILRPSTMKHNLWVIDYDANDRPFSRDDHFSDEIFSDHPELWELRSDDPQTLLEGFENGIKIAGENGEFIGIPNKGNDHYHHRKRSCDFGVSDPWDFAWVLFSDR